LAALFVGLCGNCVAGRLPDCLEGPEPLAEIHCVLLDPVLHDFKLIQVAQNR
jgi:hypothetical protein